MPSRHNAFTLIEVLVSVLIVSVVVAAIYEVKGNANTKLFWLKDMITQTQFNSFLLGNSQKYGYEKSNISINELVSEFNLESDLRRELKAEKIAIDYEEGEGMEMPTGTVLEIGKTSLESKKFSSTVLRVRIQ